MARARRDARKTASFVERFATALVESGMPRMPARVFAVMLTEDDGSATAAQLAERLKASPSAISGAVRYLAQVRLLRRDRGPGERFDTYRLHNEVWYEAIYDREHLLKGWSALTREGMAAVGPTTPAGRRLEETSEFFDFLKEEMADLLERWRNRRA